MDNQTGLHGEYKDGYWALVDANDKPITEYKYNYVTPCGNGYFRIELGAKKNILRPDGTEVLDVWFNDVYDVENGYFIIGVTKRKTDTKPTQYLRGLAHVSGTILFPPIFHDVKWNDKKTGLFAELEGKPLILTIDGSIHDPQGDHLPVKAQPKMMKFFEAVINWTLPGLQFFYRDTDAQVDVDSTYHIGDSFRAGFFVDATTKLLKPAHKIRYLIASAHFAPLFEIRDVCENNPKVHKWNLTTFHPNCCFKVMDIYRKEGVTQIFLLHIPESLAYFTGDSEAIFKFIDDATGNDQTLVELSRLSFDEKLRQEVHERSLDKEFVERMHWPVGLTENTGPITSMAPVVLEGDAKNFGDTIAKLSTLSDVELEFETKDNFPWHGVKGTVCQSCIYAFDIKGNGEGCGRLFKDKFRDNYIKGVCEYKKYSDQDQSEYEIKQAKAASAAKLKADKMSDTYAWNLLNDFVHDYLDGDLDNLRTFDIFSIMDNPKYGNPYNCNDNKILSAIISLIYGYAWPSLSVDSIEQGKFQISRICNFQNLLGANIMDQYFMALQKIAPKAGLHNEALAAVKKFNRVGNFIPWPCKTSLANILEGYSTRHYMDRLIQLLYDACYDAPKVLPDMKAALYNINKLLNPNPDVEVFIRFINLLKLNDFVDDDFKPIQVFDYVWANMKELDYNTYVNAVKRFCENSQKIIDRRTDMIVDILKGGGEVL